MRSIRTLPVSGIARHVAHVLIDYANTRGECWPSAQTIARDAVCNEKTARLAVRELEAAGWLHVTRKAGRASRFTILSVTPGATPGLPRAPRPDTPGATPDEDS